MGKHTLFSSSHGTLVDEMFFDDDFLPPPIVDEDEELISGIDVYPTAGCGCGRRGCINHERVYE